MSHAPYVSRIAQLEQQLAEAHAIFDSISRLVKERDVKVRELAGRLEQAERRHAAERERLYRLIERDLDLTYLATCVLEELEELGHLTGIGNDEDGRTSDEWRLAQGATVLALQKGLQHLAQEEGE